MFTDKTAPTYYLHVKRHLMSFLHAAFLNNYWTIEKAAEVKTQGSGRNFFTPNACTLFILQKYLYNCMHLQYVSKGDFFIFLYVIQHCFICRPSHSIASDSH